MLKVSHLRAGRARTSRHGMMQSEAEPAPTFPGYFPITSMGTVMVLGGKQAFLSQAW